MYSQSSTTSLTSTSTYPAGNIGHCAICTMFWSSNYYEHFHIISLVTLSQCLPAKLQVRLFSLHPHPIMEVKSYPCWPASRTIETMFWMSLKMSYNVLLSTFVFKTESNRVFSTLSPLPSGYSGGKTIHMSPIFIYICLKIRYISCFFLWAH